MLLRQTDEGEILDDDVRDVFPAEDGEKRRDGRVAALRDLILSEGASHCQNDPGWTSPNCSDEPTPNPSEEGSLRNPEAVEIE
jgi:hypothetical protein